MTEYRGREIPWLPVVRFHKEVVTRAEEGFFSLYGRDDQAQRWTSLPNFDPADLSDPWQIDAIGFTPCVLIDAIVDCVRPSPAR